MVTNELKKAIMNDPIKYFQDVQKRATDKIKNEISLEDELAKEAYDDMCGEE